MIKLRCRNKTCLIKKGRFFKMTNDIITIGCGLPIDTIKRKDRLAGCPLRIDGNIGIYDRLETEGILLLYEQIGESFYIPMDYDELKACKNLTFVAGISISIFENENLVHMDRYFSYYGYEEYVKQLFDYIGVFAGYYGYRSSILDLRKGVSTWDIRKCRCVDIKYW